SGTPAGTACAGSAMTGTTPIGTSGTPINGTAGAGGTMVPPGTTMRTGGSGATLPTRPLGNAKITPTTPDQCTNDPTQFNALVAAPGETCYDFQTHGVSGTTDKTKFNIPTGESYNQFYFAVPW